MNYKNYEDINENDTWITDGDGSKEVRKGKNTESIGNYDTSMQDDVNYCVPAETLPKTFFDNPPITRESTWDYDDDEGYRTVETIETWEWSDKLNRYDIVYLAEKETGEYISHNAEEYIKNDCIVFGNGIPGIYNCKKKYCEYFI